MQLYQPQNGYCYNSDTYCLYNFITKCLQKFKNINGQLLDIGAGSGILGFLVSKEYENINLNSCEIQDEFEFLSKKNAQVNNIELNLYKGDFTTLQFDKKFDIIVSNPPFYPSCVVKSTNENIKIARYNDSLPLEDFISKTSNILKPKGKFFFCYDVKLLNDIISLLKKYKINLESMQFLHPKSTKEASLVMIYARKDSKSMLEVKEPFIMFEDGDFTKNMQDIYDKCNTHSIKVNIKE
jgi:tRNA1(Val) A37 N6-methylase TrmN6